MDAQINDTDLVRQIGAGGDPSAEAELFKRMAPRIRLYGLRHLRDPHAADDLTQQVMIATLEAVRAGRLRKAEKLASFVLGTCRMMVLDLRRNAQRRERLMEQFGPDALKPVQSAAPQLDREQLARCVQGLKERERAVVVMTFYDEQTGADAARFLGVSEANLRVIRHRAIHQLRDCMGAGGLSCENPVDAAVLADYWAAALPQSEEEIVEQHLFTCDECGDRLRQVIAMAEGVRQLAREGSLLMVVSDALMQRLAGEGLRVREYAPPAGGRVACTVTPEDDFLIGRLTANLRGAKRVDLSICDRRGVETVRLADVPFDARTGSVAFQQPIGYAKAAPSETMIARLMAIDESGVETTLGEYTFDHTRTMPGPAAW